MNNLFKFPTIKDIACIKCNSTISKDSNPMFLCDYCGVGVHKEC